MEKATKSQAVNGTDHSTIMTPLRVKEAIQANGGGGGTSDHSQLSNLGYAASGHTGFQQTLVSGQNIKTINQTSILGSGNINISGGTQNHADLSNLDYANAGHTGFQPTLVSGSNIKTINGITILGAGDISVGDEDTYYYDGTRSQEMVDMLNEICGKVDNGESFKLIGHFPYTLADNTTIIVEAPMVVQKYPSSASEYEPETIFTFGTNPIVWLDWVSLKARSTAFLLMLQGTWGAFTSIDGVSTFMDNVIYNEDIANWNGKYDKPDTGIPKSDLSSSVQTSLGLADTALQSYTETDPVFSSSAAADITQQDITNWDSKSTVSVNRKVTTGVNIADVTVDGVQTQIYAPNSGGGITNHNELSNLDYANSGHTGFQATISDLSTIRSGAALGTTSVQPEDLGALATKDTVDYSTDITNKPTIPTKTSDLTNDSGYITSSYHDNTKQDTLISGTNIKTINSSSILGSGNVTLNTIPVFDTLPSADNYNLGDVIQKSDGHIYVCVVNPQNPLLHTWEDVYDLGAFVKTLTGGMSPSYKIDTISLQTDSLGNINALQVKDKDNNLHLFDLSTKQDIISDLATIRTGAALGATALQSYTETDPIFGASAAADITSSDITNWDSKSEVAIDRKTTSGTNIADITIDGVKTELYAPSGGGGSLGDIVIMSTNTPPDNSGNWELIDKEFTPYYTTTSSAITWNSTNTTPSGCTMRVARAGHSLNFTFTVNNKVQIKDDTLAIGQLNLASLGIDQIPIIQDITGWTDGGNCAVFFYVSQAGAIETRDVIPDSYVSAGNSTVFSFTAVINTGHMLDAACNKFYWKRTV